MHIFSFIFTIILFPHFSILQTFVPFGFFEYYIETNNPVGSFTEAEKRCNASQATLAVLKTKEIRNFLVKEIKKISGKRRRHAKLFLITALILLQKARKKIF